MMTVRVECRAEAQRAEILILRDDVLCGQLECELDRAFEMLVNAQDVFRVNGQGLRVEIVSRKP